MTDVIQKKNISKALPFRQSSSVDQPALTQITKYNINTNNLKQVAFQILVQLFVANTRFGIVYNDSDLNQIGFDSNVKTPETITYHIGNDIFTVPNVEQKIYFTGNFETTGGSNKRHIENVNYIAKNILPPNSDPNYNLLLEDMKSTGLSFGLPDEMEWGVETLLYHPYFEEYYTEESPSRGPIGHNPAWESITDKTESLKQLDELLKVKIDYNKVLQGIFTIIEKYGGVTDAEHWYKETKNALAPYLQQLMQAIHTNEKNPFKTGETITRFIENGIMKSNYESKNTWDVGIGIAKVATYFGDYDMKDFYILLNIMNYAINNTFLDGNNIRTLDDLANNEALSKDNIHNIQNGILNFKASFFAKKKTANDYVNELENSKQNIDEIIKIGTEYVSTKKEFPADDQLRIEKKLNTVVVNYYQTEILDKTNPVQLLNDYTKTNTFHDIVVNATTAEKTKQILSIIIDATQIQNQFDIAEKRSRQLIIIQEKIAEQQREAKSINDILAEVKTASAIDNDLHAKTTGEVGGKHQDIHKKLQQAQGIPKEEDAKRYIKLKPIIDQIDALDKAFEAYLTIRRDWTDKIDPLINDLKTADTQEKLNEITTKYNNIVNKPKDSALFAETKKYDAEVKKVQDALNAKLSDVERQKKEKEEAEKKAKEEADRKAKEEAERKKKEEEEAERQKKAGGTGGSGGGSGPRPTLSLPFADIQDKTRAILTSSLKKYFTINVTEVKYNSLPEDQKIHYGYALSAGNEEETLKNLFYVDLE
jgi:hypothetical protein